MFSDEILEKIFGRNDVQQLPLEHQSIMIHAVEEVLREDGALNDTSNE